MRRVSEAGLVSLAGIVLFFCPTLVCVFLHYTIVVSSTLWVDATLAAAVGHPYTKVPSVLDNCGARFVL